MILRVQKNENYTTINNTGLNDIKLSWGAKGLLTYLISKPNDWQIYVSHLSKQSKDGREATNNRLKELIENRYISKEQTRDEKGMFVENEYTVSEIPLTENPLTDNPELLSTNKINTDNKEKEYRVNPDDESKDSSNSNISKRDKINKSLKNNTPNKTKEILNIKTCSPIIRKSLIKFKEIVIPIFPRIKKDALIDYKEVQKVNDLINFFVHGKNKNKFSAINDEWKKENNITPITYFGEHSEFMDYLEKALRIYSNEHKPGDKSKLPTRLSDFLYNSNRKLVSYFLFYAFNPPKRIYEVKPAKDDLPEMTHYYEEIFFKKPLNIEEKNQLIKECLKIREFYDDCWNRTVLYKGKEWTVRELLYNMIILVGLCGI